MFKKRSFQVVNQKNHITVLTDAAVLAAGACAFLLLFFSVFDKEYNGEALAHWVFAAFAFGVVTLLLKRHIFIALILNLICICAIVYLNYDVLRVGYIQISNFARTHAAFILDTDVYSAFLNISVFIFVSVMAFTQNLRLSFLPLLAFLAGTTAYIVILIKPYDVNIYILYIIVCLSTTVYCLASKNSRFLGFSAFVLFGLCSVFVTKTITTVFDENSYKAYREESELISSFDQTSVVKRLYPDINISALTGGNLLTYALNGRIDKTLMAVVTLSDFQNDICFKSFTGESYTGSGWGALSDGQKSALPEQSPESISYDIASADLNSSALLFGCNKATYYIEKTESVKNAEFLPYFTEVKSVGEENGEFLELSANTLTLYDLTPETVKQALYAELSAEEAETLISRERAYSEYVYENYTSVPEELQEGIAELCRDIEVSELNSLTISSLREKLNENVAFTIAPTPTEADTDPIAAALLSGEADSNRLASIGIMALRFLGLPARYAEGIGVTAELKENADEINGVFKIDIYNTDAIAFAEVYIDGFGWLPVNFLPDNAREVADEEISAINAEKTSDLVSGIKAAASPYIKKTAKAVLAFAALVLAAAALIIAARRQIIILIRTLKINRGSKAALYNYTEQIKAFYNKNIFEETPLAPALDALFYSQHPKNTAKALYKEVKTAAKNNLKDVSLSKKLSALFIKVII